MIQIVEIKLTKRYTLSSDSYCWRVFDKIDNRPVGYYGKIKDAIEDMCEHYLRKRKAKTFGELVLYHQVFVKKLNEALKPLKVKVHTDLLDETKGDMR